MAVDVTFNTITSGYNLSKLNENFTRIDTALQDALSRSGTSPNSMSADIDLNGNDLLNVGTLSLSGGSTLSQIVGYAEEWATKAEDSLISVAAGGDGSTDYSSLHHAAKAEDSATAAAASETAASASETAAASSETNAATSETNAVAAASAVAYKYTFSTTTTMADPGAGVLRFNNGTVSSVTAIALDATTADTGNPDISDYIALWDDVTNSVAKGYLTIRKNGSPGTFAIFKVTGSVTDNTGWLQVAVTHVQSAGTFSNSDNLYIAFTQSGEDGSGSMSSFTAGNGLTDGGDNSVTNGETLSVQATSNKGAAVTANGIEVSPNNATDTAIALTDEILFADADDSNNVKKDTVQGILETINNLSDLGTSIDTASDKFIVYDASASDVKTVNAEDFSSDGWTYGTFHTLSSGSSVSWTGIPSGVTELELFMWAVNGTGTSRNLAMTIGDSGGLETSGYFSQAFRLSSSYASPTGSYRTDRFEIFGGNIGSSTYDVYGYTRLVKIDGNKWIGHSQTHVPGTEFVHSWHGKELSAELTQASFLITDSQTFNSGSVGLRYR